MKNNILLAVLIILSAAVNLQARARVPKPFQMSDEAKDPANAETLYQEFRVLKISDELESQIAEKWYGANKTITYFSDSGALDAAEMARQASEIKSTGKTIMYGSLIGGGILGIVGGVSYGKRVFPDASVGYDMSRALISLGGLIVGASIGEIGGWCIYHWNYYPEANAKYKAANDSFNHHLRQQLKLEIAPTVGGASGAVKLTY